MGTLRLPYKEDQSDGKVRWTLSQADFSRFNAGLLGLGRVSQQAEVINAVAVIFDLEGFTSFCNQIDPQLVVPEYLSGFLDWLFKAVADECRQKSSGDLVPFWAPLPFFGKFLGDGVLFLWDTALILGPYSIGNIALSLVNICKSYETVFVNNAATSYTNLPPRLRVGMARGQVLAIGGGTDFVGSCINMAARLQKLGSLSFAASRRGFDPQACLHPKAAGDFVVKKTAIRGIGNDERVVILKKELDALPPEEKALLG